MGEGDQDELRDGMAVEESDEQGDGEELGDADGVEEGLPEVVLLIQAAVLLAEGDREQFLVQIVDPKQGPNRESESNANLIDYGVREREEGGQREGSMYQCEDA